MAKKYSKAAHKIDLPMPSANTQGMDKWEVESAANTITRHHEIKANPKLHRAAKAHLKRQHKMIGKAIKG